MIFFLFHIEIEGKRVWIIGGPKGMLVPLPNYWGDLQYVNIVYVIFAKTTPDCKKEK